MHWKNRLLQNIKIYLIADTSLNSPSSLFEKTKQALEAGARLIQLRAKNIPDREFLDIANKLRRIIPAKKAIFIVNDRVDIAYSSCADGVHLGQDDIPAKKARALLRESAIVGKSAHNLKQALEAENEGCDYIGLGPIFKTEAKPDAKPLGTEPIRRIANRVSIPVFVLGGINQNNIKDVVAKGADRIAVSRAVFKKSKTKDAFKALKFAMQK